MQFNRNDYLTIKEAAERLGYFPPYVRKLIRDGKLEAVKRGRQYFILPAKISKFVNIPEPTQVGELI